MTTHPDLPYEQAKNKEYLDKLYKRLQRNPLRDVARNVLWIDAVGHQINANSYHHPLRLAWGATPRTMTCGTSTSGHDSSQSSATLSTVGQRRSHDCSSNPTPTAPKTWSSDDFHPQGDRHQRPLR